MPVEIYFTCINERVDEPIDLLLNIGLHACDDRRREQPLDNAAKFGMARGVDLRKNIVHQPALFPEEGVALRGIRAAHICAHVDFAGENVHCTGCFDKQIMARDKIEIGFRIVMYRVQLMHKVVVRKGTLLHVSIDDRRIRQRDCRHLCFLP